MIAFVKGAFVYKSPAEVWIDVNGVGYALQISLYTYSAIEDKAEAQLYTYLHITENAQTLYGFFDVKEKELFLHLISVAGVGAGTARMMLSGMQPDEIIKYIVQGNTKMLESIKGIGKKTAERIVVELKDKLGKWNMAAVSNMQSKNSIPEDALQALISLGISATAAQQALEKAMSLTNDDTIKLEELIKLSLKTL